MPSEPRRAYDVRDALAGIVDAGSLLELCPRWARNVVTTFGRIEGRPVGIVANQPHYLGGVLDAESSEKAARFVGFCDSFGLPLIAVVDTPGFMPGSEQEQAGVIRHGASLVRAFAAARVPKLTVVLRKSYGGAYITMNSRDLGADLVLAWPRPSSGSWAPGPPSGSSTAASCTPRTTRGRADAAGARRVRRGASARGRGRRRRVRRRADRAGRTRASGSPCALLTLARREVVILEGKKLLITGVITKDSIAFHAAERALEEGAAVLLTSFGRVRRHDRAGRQRLSAEVDVLELDVNSPDDLAALTDSLRERWGSVDGVLHAIAFAPEDALGGRFMTAPPESASRRFRRARSLSRRWRQRWSR